MKSLIKLFTFIVFVGAAMFPVYAFASSSSGTKTSGEGNGAVSGWTISNVHYQLSADPSLIQAVTFDLDAPANMVSVKLSSKNLVYASCVNLSAYQWQCSFPSGVSIASMDELHVVALGN